MFFVFAPTRRSTVKGRVIRRASMPKRSTQGFRRRRTALTAAGVGWGGSSITASTGSLWLKPPSGVVTDVRT